MWWPEPPHDGRVARLARLALALGRPCSAGCFQPLYGERTLTGGPGLRQRLSAVEVDPIKAPNGTPRRASRSRCATS